VPELVDPELLICEPVAPELLGSVILEPLDAELTKSELVGSILLVPELVDPELLICEPVAPGLLGSVILDT
jgi:hypothetical protein